MLLGNCEGALESGEIISAGIIREQLMELGQVLQVETRADEASKAQLIGWLAEDFVIYKGVGECIIDLAVAEAPISLAQEQNVRTVVSDF
ncbi:hypothetical protein N7455_012228 [Penicillium solitum]|uniref:uncharacterized protein n=1 Tax=Penicillium solitum TaxID=60172 RepID=UPI0018285FD2|nr:hypothetical protein HAV15_002753 [Penicillium sp. str. \